jgi:hypothetical protein
LRPKKWGLRTLLMVGIVVLVIVNLMVTIRLAVDTRASAARVWKQPSLPCGAIPTRFVMEEPECADKLLRSMNVTNVRVLPSKALDTVQTEPVTQGWHNLSGLVVWWPAWVETVE